MLLQGNAPCSCTDCKAQCIPPDFSDYITEDFCIVPGVDGVVFIMVIIFVVVTIIFLAIVLGSYVMKNTSCQCKFFSFLFLSFEPTSLDFDWLIRVQPIPEQLSSNSQPIRIKLYLNGPIRIRNAKPIVKDMLSICSLSWVNGTQKNSDNQ